MNLAVDVVAAAVVGAGIGGLIPAAIHRISDDDNSAGESSSPSTVAGGWTPAGKRFLRSHSHGWREAAVTAAVTAIVLAVLTARLRHDIQLPATAVTAVLAITAASVDLRCRRLPDAIVLPGTVICLASVATTAVLTHDLRRLVLGFAGTAGVTAVLLVLAVLTGGLGMGDVKAGMWMSVLAGWHSPTALVIAAVGPFLIQSAIILPMLVARRATRRSELPFGPALLLAGLSSLLLTP